MTARISPCQQYRYFLARPIQKRWFDQEREEIHTWIMLNPSTADAYSDDNTIRRILSFSADAKMVNVVNLSAYRATDPQQLEGLSVAQLKGDSGLWMAGFYDSIKEADKVICAWGAGININPNLTIIAREVRDLFLNHHKPWCLGMTKAGLPRHPLYVAKSQPFMPVMGHQFCGG